MQPIKIKIRASEEEALTTGVASLLKIAQDKLLKTEKYSFADAGPLRFTYFMAQDTYYSASEKDNIKVSRITYHIPTTGADILKSKLVRYTAEGAVESFDKKEIYGALNHSIYKKTYKKSKTGFMYILQNNLVLRGESVSAKVAGDDLPLGSFYDIEKAVEDNASTKEIEQGKEEIYKLIETLELPKEAIETRSWPELIKKLIEKSDEGVTVTK